MDIFEIHTYDRMPVPAPLPPAVLAFDVLFRRVPQAPIARVPFWRTLLANR